MKPDRHLLRWLGLLLAAGFLVLATLALAALLVGAIFGERVGVPT